MSIKTSKVFAYVVQALLLKKKKRKKKEKKKKEKKRKKEEKKKKEKRKKEKKEKRRKKKKYFHLQNPSRESYIKDHSPECCASYSFYLLCARPVTVQTRSTSKLNKALNINNSSTFICINLSRIKTIMFTLLITTLLQTELASSSSS